MYESPVDGAQPVETRARFELISPLAAATTPKGWMRIASARYVRASAVAMVRAVPRPPEVGANERWIDIDRDTQTLVAYQGDKPVFATLVSTGTDEHPTPPGRRRIGRKLRTADMDNLEKPAPDAGHYFVEAVPWVQYFDSGVALHGTFWHRRFGHPHSHGCVNLAPRDARWLFDFTEPRIVPGHDEVDGAGTLVQVR